MENRDVRNSASQWVLGLDCGQTHSEAVIISDAGAVLCRTHGGPTHIQGASMEATFHTALLEMMKNIPDDVRAKVTLVGAGVTGFGIPGKLEALGAVLENWFPQRPQYFASDVVTAHVGASAGNRSAATILSGTGSIAYGTHQGHAVRLGGHGYLFGDEGSGNWIGFQAAKRAILAAEGRGPATSLETSAPLYFGVSNMKALPGHIYASGTVDVQKFARFVPTVVNAALDGDAVAQSIISEAAKHLADIGCYLMEQLYVDVNAEFPVYRVGGIWNAGEMLIEPVLSGLRHKFPAVQFMDALEDPAIGAARFAIDSYAK